MASVKSTQPRRLSKSCLGEEEKRAVMGVLDRGFLGMGADVQQFRAGIVRVFWSTDCLRSEWNRRHLHLALQACGIGSGDEVRSAIAYLCGILSGYIRNRS
jgi:dTDP-4-amino-4,6-dideoxygalactose transaminase